MIVDWPRGTGYDGARPRVATARRGKGQRRQASRGWPAAAARQRRGVTADRGWSIAVVCVVVTAPCWLAVAGGGHRTPPRVLSRLTSEPPRATLSEAQFCARASCVGQQANLGGREAAADIERRRVHRAIEGSRGASSPPPPHPPHIDIVRPRVARYDE